MLAENSKTFLISPLFKDRDLGLQRGEGTCPESELAFQPGLLTQSEAPDVEKEMATHSSVLAWRIPGTGEPAGLPSMGSQSRTRLKRLSSRGS